MRRREFFLGVVALLLLLSCASHKPARQPPLSIDPVAQASKVERGGILCMVKALHQKSDLEEYFDVDLMEKGILPVQVYLCNQAHGRNVYFTRDGVSLMDPSEARHPALSNEQVLDKVEKSYWRTVGWGVAFGVLGAIPSAMNVSSTNKKIKEDLESRSLKDGNLVCETASEGLVFFSVPPDINSLDGWRVSIMLLDPKTSENILLGYDLKGPVEPRKVEKLEEGRGEMDSG